MTWSALDKLPARKDLQRWPRQAGIEDVECQSTDVPTFIIVGSTRLLNCSAVTSPVDRLILNATRLLFCWAMNGIDVKQQANSPYIYIRVHICYACPLLQHKQSAFTIAHQEPYCEVASSKRSQLTLTMDGVAAGNAGRLRLGSWMAVTWRLAGGCRWAVYDNGLFLAWSSVAGGACSLTSSVLYYNNMKEERTVLESCHIWSMLELIEGRRQKHMWHVYHSQCSSLRLTYHCVPHHRCGPSRGALSFFSCFNNKNNHWGKG